MPDVGRGFEDLVAILDSDRAMAQADADRPPSACPYDLQPLESTQETLHCRFCGRTFNPGSPPERGWR